MCYNIYICCSRFYKMHECRIIWACYSTSVVYPCMSTVIINMHGSCMILYGMPSLHTYYTGRHMYDNILILVPTFKLNITLTCSPRLSSSRSYNYALTSIITAVLLIVTTPSLHNVHSMHSHDGISPMVQIKLVYVQVHSVY